MRADGLLIDQMHVRGYDAEGIAEKETAGAIVAEMGSMQGHMRETSDWIRTMGERRERMEHTTKLEVPENAYHRCAFVSLAKASTGEVISQGLCRTQYRRLSSWCTEDDYRRRT